MTANPVQKVLFVTGRLAEPALRRTLAEAALPFPYELVVMPISVAALMTTQWLAYHFNLPASHPRHRRVPEDCDQIMIPGNCEGDVAEIEQICRLPVRKGPIDLQDIPRHFGREQTRAGYGAYSIQIMAEIQDALRLSEADLLQRAAYYRVSGAEVIDLGITPGSTGQSVAHTVRLLKANGYQVSVDTLDSEVIRQADAAGVDYVLSLNQDNLSLGQELRARPVVIPDEEGEVESLWRNAEQLWQWGVDCLLDPIAQPIGFGFSRSLFDLVQTRQRYPEAKLMLGVHHLSELTDADSTGINTLLMGLAQELNLSFVLTTEVAPWAKGSVRELDIARRLMHYAVGRGVPPKRIEDGLLTVKDSRLLRQDYDTLREMHAALTDPNIRIYLDPAQIYAFNHQVFAAGTDIELLFNQLDIHEVGHAFYLGCELTKAQLALQLGKTYHQDRALRWGYLTVEEPSGSERHRRLTSGRVSSSQPTDNEPDP
jgi:dihydropteroate synthase